MKGDFSRQTFDAARHFSRVLMQQGRVQLDADWNEQAAILLHYLQSLAADLIGPHGGPKDIVDQGKVNILQQNCGFEMIASKDRIAQVAFYLSDDEKTRLNGLFDKDVPHLLIGKGHYYVDGVLCENEDYIPYSKQPDLPDAELKAGTYLAYLDVWERHITCIEENRIREIALGGPDTATRAKIVWQVKTTDKRPDGNSIPTTMTRTEVNTLMPKWIDNWQPANHGQLKVKGKQPQKKIIEPCLISPDAKYRGAENHLYRVEVHQSTPEENGNGNSDAATIKWSRDNGSVVFPIRTLQGNTITLEHLGLEEQRSLQVGQWVEIMDDNLAKRGEAGPYLQVETIDPVEKIVTLINQSAIELTNYIENDPKHPLLRRWDSELFNIAESNEKWIDLEDGVCIQFQPKASGNDHFYRVGDYWLIPARTATGDVEWPMEEDGKGGLVPVAQPPHGVEHHYAPLAIITVDATGTVTVTPEKDCRCTIVPSAK
jgi:hypothetical protein